MCPYLTANIYTAARKSTNIHNKTGCIQNKNIKIIFTNTQILQLFAKKPKTELCRKGIKMPSSNAWVERSKNLYCI